MSVLHNGWSLDEQNHLFYFLFYSKVIFLYIDQINELLKKNILNSSWNNV